jgi:hypothetical protein
MSGSGTGMFDFGGWGLSCERKDGCSDGESGEGRGGFHVGISLARLGIGL